jgi:hypothetical protein
MSDIGGRSRRSPDWRPHAFQEPAHSHVLVPLGHAVTDVAQREGRDVDAARQQTIALLGGNAL